MLCAAGSAAADDGGGLQWSPRFARFTTAQYVLTGALAGGLLATDRLLPPAGEAHWRGGILLDSQARSWLAAQSESGRETASRISSYMTLGLMLYPFAVDSLLVAGVVHDDFDVAYQMTLIGLQGLLLAKLVTGLTKDLVGRARPDAGDCLTGHELACGESTESFISGHTSGAFAGAGLICANHQNLALYGDGAAGSVACGLALGTAGTVGALRVVAGRHYLSDVLAGAAVGFAAGYLLPNLTNYDFGASRAAGVITPIAGTGTFGLGYLRVF
jgi:membrane-associated phospholipid phosphatase